MVAPSPTTPGAPRVRLHPHGLELGTGEVVPLICGAMHYWRHSPAEWGAGLDAMNALGFRVVDTYIPWGIHERSPGDLDFGDGDGRLDVVRFLRMIEERGLHAIVRPGPHINAELSFFGLPERIVWDRACQARTPRGNPVLLPMVPSAFPVPSYASDVFHDETARWFEAVAARIAHLAHPSGPIVMIQVDNEGALYFRDGPYDQDYHPDAIRLFRAFLEAKYGSIDELRAAWQEPALAFATVEPPHRFDARTADDLPRHMDWMEFHEHLLTSAMGRMAKTLAKVGFDRVPTSHNFPLGEAATPLNPARVGRVVDLVGLDYYHHANPSEHTVMMRRTSELVSRCEGNGTPAFGAEVGAGFPPFFAPLDEKDSLYTIVCALAYGLRGYNIYMAVERDRWVGAPIDPHGRRRPFGDAFVTLHRALERTRFHTLHRRAPVRLVVPRSLRRLARATHAFGPITPALFNVLGAGFRESVLENDLGMGQIATMAGEAYLRAFERALLARGVPFAYAGGETVDESVAGAQWIVVATVGGVKPEVFTSLRAIAANAKVTIGPHVPERDGTMRRMRAPHDTAGLEIEPLDDVARADSLVAKRIEELALPTYPVDPADAFVCVHDDESGAPKVVILMNPTPHEVVAKVALPGVGALVDVLGEARIARVSGAFEVPIEARNVRMFAVE